MNNLYSYFVAVGGAICAFIALVFILEILKWLTGVIAKTYRALHFAHLLRQDASDHETRIDSLEDAIARRDERWRKLVERVEVLEKVLDRQQMRRFEKLISDPAVRASK